MNLSSFTKPQIGIFIFTTLYIVYFGQYFLRKLNYEFILYVVLVVAIMLFLYGTLHLTRFPTYLIGGLSIWGLLHLMGGSVPTPDGVLYDWRVYPFIDRGGEFFILRFDQVVHAGLYAIVALLVLHLLREVCGLRDYKALVAVIAIMAALGIGCINEIVEFIVAMTDPNNGVGGYVNTMLDIISNFTGATLALLGYYIVKKLKKGA